MAKLLGPLLMVVGWIGLGLGAEARGQTPEGLDESPEAPIAPVLARVEDLCPPDELIPVGTIKTRVVRRGDAGRPVVLIHGFGSSTYSWRHNIDALGEHFQVFALDLKGFGLTEKPQDGQYHLKALTEHVLEFLDTFGIERPVLVGNSLGGAVALRLALLHPDRVGALVLVNAALPVPIGLRIAETAAQDDARPEQRLVRPSLLFQLPRLLTPELVRLLVTPELVERGLRSGYRNPEVVTPEMVAIYHRPITIEGAAEALVAMLNPPPEALDVVLPPLESLEVPVLIIWGRYDRVIPLTVARHLVRKIAGARLHILENSGHLPHEEEPEAFNALVSQFVEEVK